MRFLLVEDDPAISHTLGAALAEQFYVVDVAEDGQEGLDYTRSFTYDLIILDVTLPRLDGLSLCRHLRREKYTGPILLLTAKGETEDKVKGLDAGADDYVVKPCTVQELMARVRALLRRQRSTDAPVLEWGPLRLDPSAGQVTYSNRPINLSPKEYSLLELFLRHPRRLFSRNAILEHLWSVGDFPGEETVKAHIKGVRRKLALVGARDLIETVYGMGYRLRPGSAQVPEPQDGDVSLRLRSALDRAWERFEGMIYERLESLERVTAGIGADRLCEADRLRALEDAHKLIGSLGPFGLVRGSQLARAIEEQLQQLQPYAQDPHSPPDPNGFGFAANSAATSPTATNRHSILQLAHQTLIALVGDLRREIQSRQQIEHNRLRLVYLGNNSRWSQALAAAIAQEGALIDLVLPSSPTTWLTQPATALPSVVIMDWSDPERADFLAVLPSLRQRQPSLIAIALMEQSDPNDLLQFANEGWDTDWAVDRPITPLIQALSQYQTEQRIGGNLRILAIGLSNNANNLVRRCCQQQQWTLAAVSQPQRVSASMAASRPDLILLAADSSPWGGVLWTRALRSEGFGGRRIPVIVFASEASPQTLDRLYQAGATACILELPSAEELADSLRQQLIRASRSELFNGRATKPISKY